MELDLSKGRRGRADHIVLLLLVRELRDSDNVKLAVVSSTAGARRLADGPGRNNPASQRIDDVAAYHDYQRGTTLCR